MNITQAKAHMKKLWGKNAMWRYDERAPNAEQRAEAEARRMELRAASDNAKAALEARRLELLKDPEYVRLKAEYQAAYDAKERNDAITRHYKVTIGRSTGFAFAVEAQGDNWHEAIEKALGKSVRA